MLYDFVVDMKGQRWYNLRKINFFIQLVRESQKR